MSSRTLRKQFVIEFSKLLRTTMFMENEYFKSSNVLSVAKNLRVAERSP